MHRVAFERFGVNRLKRAEANVQSKFAHFHASRANCFKNLDGEVQARCGSGYRARMLGKYRLIALAI